MINPLIAKNITTLIAPISKVSIRKSFNHGGQTRACAITTRAQAIARKLSIWLERFFGEMVRVEEGSGGIGLYLSERYFPRSIMTQIQSESLW